MALQANQLSFLDSVTAICALAAAIRYYHSNWKNAPYSRVFWLPEATRAYGVYRRLGGSSHFHEIISQ